ncbi:MAG: [Clostridia bacterium]|nr:[FeFe] hydrogenase H-cluster radical SAM maturase HydE [Clostridia bacterium]
MNDKLIQLIEKLEAQHTLSIEEYEYLITHRNEEAVRILAEKARSVREKIYGKSVFIRGLIEVSNFCRNDCLYCGIRRSNKDCSRYRLTEDEILECCREGYALGFRTFVMQGGEDSHFSDDFMCSVVKKIKAEFPDCAVTLSLGERSCDSYKKLYNAGADRYLLRHETADKEHYEKLHPSEMSFDKRMECLRNLKSTGFQTGCGFMVGSPFQTERHIAADLKFIEEFSPDMCGIGPFIPHDATPFSQHNAGSAELTCYLLSIIRLIKPNILLPSTTALGTLLDDGHERGILSGANVIMPNLSPSSVRKKYELYNNKKSFGDEAAEAVDSLRKKIQSIGYEIISDRGDIKKG